MKEAKVFIAGARRYMREEMYADEYACGQHCDKTSMLSTPQRSAHEAYRSVAAAV